MSTASSTSIDDVAKANGSGASHVIKALLAEFQLTLHLAGITSCHSRGLNRSRMVMQSYL